MVTPWSGQPVMMGQPMGQTAMRRSMHELGTIPAPAMPMAAFFVPPLQQRTSSPSAASQTSEWSRVSEVARQPQPQPQKLVKGGNARKKRQKREKRFNKTSSRPQSRSHSRNSQKDWNESNYPRSEESDKRDSEEGRGEEEEEDVEVSAVAAKAEPVWMCDYCTYANGANLAVCQMCAKTAVAARGGGSGGKDRKSKRGKRPSSPASSTAAKSAVKSGRGEGRTAAAAKGSRMPLKSPAGSEENDDTEQDVKRAYYAVRRSAGGKMMERGGLNPILIEKSRILIVF